MSDVPVAVVMPVYNDWIACHELLTRLDRVLAARYRTIPVFVVDDGTQQADPSRTLNHPFVCLEPTVLQLRRNLGHQRAICIGLAYVHATISPEITIVMDSDGEDAPEDVPRLLDAVKAAGDAIVFAKRTKRSESYLFRIGYSSFKLLHRLATGHGIAFGNFSAIPRERLASLVSVGDLWNNYAASVLVSRQRYLSIPTTRARRLAGAPHMNVAALTIHGLSAISVFGEVVALRLTLLGAIGAALTACALVMHLTGLIVLSTSALVLVAVMAVSSVQVTGFALLFAFLTLSRRSAMVFQPARDAQSFIYRVVRPEVMHPTAPA